MVWEKSDKKKKLEKIVASIEKIKDNSLKDQISNLVMAMVCKKTKDKAIKSYAKKCKGAHGLMNLMFHHDEAKDQKLKFSPIETILNLRIPAYGNKKEVKRELPPATENLIKVHPSNLSLINKLLKAK
jgi:hypothetical protein